MAGIATETRTLRTIAGETVVYTVFTRAGRVVRTSIPIERPGLVCPGCPICAQGGRR